MDNNMSENPLIRPINNRVKGTISNIVVRDSKVTNSRAGLINLMSGYSVNYATISIINNTSDNALIRFNKSEDEDIIVKRFKCLKTIH